MARYDIILQGGGKLILAAEEGQLRNDEAGAIMRGLQEYIDSGQPIAVLNGVGKIIDNRPLNEQNLTKITTCDRSSGKYHERWIEVQLDGNERILTDERCQADQSGNFDVVEAPREGADRNELCYYCYPPVENAVTYTAGPI